MHEIRFEGSFGGVVSCVVEQGGRGPLSVETWFACRFVVAGAFGEGGHALFGR